MEAEEDGSWLATLGKLSVGTFVYGVRSRNEIGGSFC